jgi:hypothetical protein
MNVYIDSSVILRLLLMEANPFEEWGKWKVAFSSELAKVEGWRNIHRLHVSKAISGEEFKNLSNAAEWLLAQSISFDLIRERCAERQGRFPRSLARWMRFTYRRRCSGGKTTAKK